MLEVLYGPFQPALEGAFLERLRSLRAGDPLAPVAVVAPSRRMVDRLQRLAALEHGAAFLGLHFHTFHSLAQGVLADAGSEGRLVVDPLFHDRLIDLILSRTPGLEKRFGGERPKALASALRASVLDLADAAVRPQALLEHFGGESPEGRSLPDRLHGLLGLQAEYEGRLEAQSAILPSGAALAAAAAAEGSRFLAGFKEILYYGVYDLTGCQLEFFERVASAFPAALFFPYIPGHPAFKFSDDFFELKLHGYGAPRAVPYDRDATALGGAAHDLFAALPPRPAGAGAALKVFNASGSRDEIWRVSKEILRLVEEEGVGFEDVGVVARSLDPYRSAVAEVFDADGVPYELPEAEGLLRHPLAKTCAGLLTMVRRDFPATAVADVLHSPYLNLESLLGAARAGDLRAEAPRRVDRLEISSGWPVWEAKLKAASKAAHPDPEMPPSEASSMLEVLAALRKDLSGDGASRGWGEWSRRARAIVDAWLSLPEDASPAEAAAWEAIRDGVDSLADFEPLGPADWDFFLDTLVEKLEACSLEPPPRRGVRVRDAMDARGESFRVLFLIGLQEGMFPRQIREDPLLRDEDRARLRHPAGYWIARKASGHDEEKLLFALLVLSARERLYCVYSRSDDEGRAKSPSLYLRELCRVAGLDLGASEHVPRPPAMKLSSIPPRLLSRRETAVLGALRGADRPPYVEALDGWGAAGKMDGLTGPSPEIGRALLKRGLSPSALESFSACPFQFFSQYVLDLGEAEEEPGRGRIPPPVRGEIYHRALEGFYKDLAKSGFWDKPSPPAWEGRLDAAADRAFSERTWKDLGVYPLVWKAAGLAMKGHLRRFVEWDMARIRADGLVPRFWEQEVEGTLPIPSLSPSLRALRFRGRADRVDMDPDKGRYRIVDYKTSWRRYRSQTLERLIKRARMHQLPIYAELMPEVLPARSKGWELEGLACYLLEEDDPEARARECSGAWWSEERADALEGIGSIADAALGGWFPIIPEDGPSGHCRFCSFSGVCRKSHGPSRRRAEEAYGKSALKRLHARS